MIKRYFVVFTNGFESELKDKKIIKDGLRSKLKEKISVELSEELEGIEDLVKFKEFAKNNFKSQKKTILTELWLEIIDNLILEEKEIKEFKENKEMN